MISYGEIESLDLQPTRWRPDPAGSVPLENAPFQEQSPVISDTGHVPAWCSAPEFCAFLSRFDFTPPPNAA